MRGPPRPAPFRWHALCTRRGGTDAIEDGKQRRPQAVKFFEVSGRQAREPLFPRGGQMQEDAATVVRVVEPLDQTGFRQTVDEFDGAVMPDAQPLGKIADRRGIVYGKAFDRQERLVVPRA